jgi:hypothetical protein
MKNVLGCLSMAVLAVVLAAPMPAQSIVVKANVPFDFMVGGRTLPAGVYEFGTISQGGVLRVMRESGSPSAMAASSASSKGDSSTAVSVEFHRYGNEYFLYKVWNGSASYGREIPASRIERELSTRASVNRPETVMVLARL